MPIIPLILQYWRQILAGIGALCLVASIFYVRHVFAQNEARRIALLEKTSQIENMKAAFEQYIRLNGDIANAVSKINQKTNVVIRTIENSTPPPDGSRFVFMSSSSVYSKANLTFIRSSSAAAGGR